MCHPRLCVTDRPLRAAPRGQDAGSPEEIGLEARTALAAALGAPAGAEQPPAGAAAAAEGNGGPGQEMRLSQRQFLAAVGQLKIRGTSKLLRLALGLGTGGGGGGWNWAAQHGAVAASGLAAAVPAAWGRQRGGRGEEAAVVVAAAGGGGGLLPEIHRTKETTTRSPCSKCRLSSSMMALITSNQAGCCRRSIALKRRRPVVHAANVECPQA